METKKNTFNARNERLAECLTVTKTRACDRRDHIQVMGTVKHVELVSNNTCFVEESCCHSRRDEGDSRTVSGKEPAQFGSCIVKSCHSYVPISMDCSL